MRIFFIVIILFAAMLTASPAAHAATLSLEPSGGTFTIGSTFGVSLYLNTKGEQVNAVETLLSFPADKLQIVSPATGFSVINNWLRQPTYNNMTGTVQLHGVIPSGIYADHGLISTLVFRVKSSGRAIVRILDGSKVLLADGKGTDALDSVTHGVFELVLPAPAGPIVISETHPDSTKWYANSSVVLQWGGDRDVEEYSYLLDEEPTTIPDNTVDGRTTSAIYRQVGDGTRFFHIKSYRNGVWGGITHYAVNIDTTPPAEFPIEIIPDSRTTRRQPVIQFSTTDSLSGLDHYELKLISLQTHQVNASDGNSSQPLSIEVRSPYVTPPLDMGSYDVVISAFDHAGNERKVTERLRIVSALFRFIDEQGLEVRGTFVVPWNVVWTGAVVLLGVLVSLAYLARRRHEHHHIQLAKKELPEKIRKHLEILATKRRRYHRATLIFLLLGISLVIGRGNVAHAQDASFELAPPLVTSVSRNITDEEIFYVGGKADTAHVEVLIYLQNLRTGGTESYIVQSDKSGNWFYRHKSFSAIGDYLLWTQARVNDITSPPGPQIQISVRPTAIQFGVSHISYEALYLFLLLLFLAATAGLAGYIVYHGLHARVKRQAMEKEIQEAEESVKRGFAVLRHDIEAELAVIRKGNFRNELRKDSKEKEAQLLKDMEEMEKYIGKEIWDIERSH